MSKKRRTGLDFPDENLDRDKKPKEELNAETEIDNLAFNKEANSYEYDVDVEDGDYDHPDPYKTVAENGADFNSDYDEANKEALDQYKDDPNSIVDEYEMRIDSGKITEVSPEDEELAKSSK